MRRILTLCAVAFLLSSANAIGAGSDDKAEYDRRAAARYASLFQSLDRNGDGVVTRTEAQGDLQFFPRFDDMDINRDGNVTLIELQRFVEQYHGVQLQFSSATAAPAR